MTSRPKTPMDFERTGSRETIVWVNELVTTSWCKLSKCQGVFDASSLPKIASSQGHDQHRNRPENPGRLGRPSFGNAPGLTGLEGFRSTMTDVPDSGRSEAGRRL